jgi:crotonobetainyl-CoA:carnitine CoA-transferase CaiB-like acyl-CoA transferase
MSTLPLEGVRVVSFAQIAQGPAAVQMLADYGADVIKVEPPGRGAWERKWANANLYPGGQSLLFLMFNRNQRSLTLNVKHPRGREIAFRLIEQADVVIENFRTGVMERLGLGYTELAQRNPRLIYCASSGYGVKHPLRDKVGQDLLVQARSGLAWLNSLVLPPPHQTKPAVVDIHASLLVVIGVLLALQSRQQTGRGQRVDTSLLDSAFHLQIESLTAAMNGWNYRAKGGSEQPYGNFDTKDGSMAIAHAPATVLAKLLDEPALAEFTEAEQFTRGDEVARLVRQRLRTRTTQEWLDVLEPAGIWCAPVCTYDEVLAEDGVLTADQRWTFRLPTGEPVATLAPPVTLSETQATIRRIPPGLGQHTQEILEEIGLPADEIAELRRGEVI